MQAKHILIATGAKATKLPIEGAEHAIISDHVLDLPERPNKMAIIGGGYIAVEFAGIFNNYGTDVHLVFRQVDCRDSVLGMSLIFCLVLCRMWTRQLSAFSLLQ